MSATRFTQYETQQLIAKAGSFLSRLGHLNPIPQVFDELGVREFYYRFFPVEDQQMFAQINQLQQHRTDDTRYGAAPWSENVTGNFILPRALFDKEGGNAGDTVTCTVNINVKLSTGGTSDRIFVPYHGGPIFNIDHPFYDELMPWVARHIRLEQIKSDARGLFYKIAMECKTPGQWNTVFPEFTMLLERNKQATISARKKNSPWPRGLSRSLAQDISALAKLFAKCALLPEWEPPQIAVTKYRPKK